MPGRPNLDIPVFEGRVPKPEEVAFLNATLLKAVITLGKELRTLNAKWAIGGDAGEIIKGVLHRTDHLEILTTTEGVAEVCALLAERLTLAPTGIERRLPRDADIDAGMYPVYIKARYAELLVDGVKVEVYGDEQIKVGDWEWGDPLDFEPDYSYVVGSRVPVVPLRLKTELDLGLGWLDRIELISNALARGQHHIAGGGPRR